eukprot:scpid81840/ scgid30444/ 
MEVTGTDLKKRKRYLPKGDKEKAYRCLKKQNDWLISNVFDASGNFLYCRSCITRTLRVSNQRLSRLRKMRHKYIPPEHGLQAKQPNRAKSTVKAQFLEFVDANRAPNGRRAGSSSAENFFDAQFNCFCSPDKGVADHDIRARRSVVGSFNLSQDAAGRQHCGNYAAR